MNWIAARNNKGGPSTMSEATSEKPKDLKFKKTLNLVNVTPPAPPALTCCPSDNGNSDISEIIPDHAVLPNTVEKLGYSLEKVQLK